MMMNETIMKWVEYHVVLVELEFKLLILLLIIILKYDWFCSIGHLLTLGFIRHDFCWS